MPELIGICDICGNALKLITCSLCGSRTCLSCSIQGVCKNCKSGKR